VIPYETSEIQIENFIDEIGSAVYSNNMPLQNSHWLLDKRYNT